MKFISYLKSNPAMSALYAVIAIGGGVWAYMWFSPYAKLKKAISDYVKKYGADATPAPGRPIKKEEQAVFDFYWNLGGNGLGSDRELWVKYIQENMNLTEAQIKEYLILPAA